MFKNPFTPTFGGKPDFFFGRRGILDDFDKANSEIAAPIGCCSSRAAGDAVRRLCLNSFRSGRLHKVAGPSTSIPKTP